MSSVSDQLQKILTTDNAPCAWPSANSSPQGEVPTVQVAETIATLFTIMKDCNINTAEHYRNWVVDAKNAIVGHDR